MSYKRISIDEARELIELGNYTLLDIRDSVSFSAGNIESAVNVTNENIEEIVQTTEKSQPLIIYCYHGNSSQGAADYFDRLGFTMAYSVDGGYEQWKHRQ